MQFRPVSVLKIATAGWMVKPVAMTTDLPFQDRRIASDQKVHFRVSSCANVSSRTFSFGPLAAHCYTTHGAKFEIEVTGSGRLRVSYVNERNETPSNGTEWMRCQSRGKFSAFHQRDDNKVRNFEVEFIDFFGRCLRDELWTVMFTGESNCRVITCWQVSNFDFWMQVDRTNSLSPPLLFALHLRPNGSTDYVELKRFSVELLKSYRTV